MLSATSGETLAHSHGRDRVESIPLFVIAVDGRNGDVPMMK
jgi:hypothetical protein